MLRACIQKLQHLSLNIRPRLIQPECSHAKEMTMYLVVKGHVSPCPRIKQDASELHVGVFGCQIHEIGEELVKVRRSYLEG